MSDKPRLFPTIPQQSKLDEREVHIHGANIIQKENHRTKYMDGESRKLLSEIRKQYDRWKKENESLRGPFLQKAAQDEKTIEKRTKLFSDYKDFIDQRHYAEKFDSRSNLHSSVLEEFIYFLFRDLVSNFPGRPLIGKSSSFKDLFFFPASFTEMVSSPHARIEIKDHDFVIGATIEARFNCRGVGTAENYALELPAVAIECKTYLDKTMLEGSSTAAAQLKYKNPNALYIVVMEWLKLTSEINLKKYAVDQIYVFRRQKNTDREFRYDEGYDKKPIDAAVVSHLYNTVREHLSGAWGGSVEEGLERGWLI
jgi:hypothetical protein